MKHNNTLQGTFDPLPIFANAKTGIASNAPERGRWVAMEMSSRTEWYALCEKRWSPGGYSTLTEDEKVWINIRALIDSTNNGGLISFFYNSYADTLQDSLRSLDRLRAGDVRLQVERVAALFGQCVPSNGDARNKIINSWPDDPRIDALLDNVDSYLYSRFPDLENRLANFLAATGLAT